MSIKDAEKFTSKDSAEVEKAVPLIGVACFAFDKV